MPARAKPTPPLPLFLAAEKPLKTVTKNIDSRFPLPDQCQLRDNLSIAFAGMQTNPFPSQRRLGRSPPPGAQCIKPLSASGRWRIDAIW